MVKIKNLKAGYGDLQILNGINLEANSNEITLIIGPNGCGKSTLLKSVYNLIDIYSGDVELDGISIKGLPSYDLIKLGVSFVLQRNIIFPTLSVYENLEIAGEKFYDKKILVQEIDLIFKKFKFLKEFSNVKATNLSGGQQRILAIAMALLQKPKILLLDEPSVGLSPKMVKEIFDMIVKIKKEGVTIILVEQNVRLAAEICDKIYILDKGEIAYSGNKNLLKKKVIREVYLGK